MTDTHRYTPAEAALYREEYLNGPMHSFIATAMKLNPDVTEIKLQVLQGYGTKLPDAIEFRLVGNSPRLEEDNHLLIHETNFYLGYHSPLENGGWWMSEDAISLFSAFCPENTRDYRTCAVYTKESGNIHHTLRPMIRPELDGIYPACNWYAEEEDASWPELGFMVTLTQNDPLLDKVSHYSIKKYGAPQDLESQPLVRWESERSYRFSVPHVREDMVEQFNKSPKMRVLMERERERRLDWDREIGKIFKEEMNE